MATAACFAGVYGVPESRIQKLKKLYHAHTPVFYEVIREIPDGVETAAVFSHNPGITEFVNSLTATKLDNMPTCAIFGVSADIDDWIDFARAEKKFWFFDYPKA